MIRAAVLAWLFLVGASIGTGLLIEDDALEARTVVALILLIAVIKVRMIVLHYIELKHAPLRWRLTFELWPVVAASLILGLWLFTAGGPVCAPA